MNNQRKEKNKVAVFILGIFVFIFVAILAGFLFGKKYFEKQKEEKIEKEFIAQKEREEREEIIKEKQKNYFEVNDGTLGIEFKVNKKFGRFSNQALSKKNESFIFGFFSVEDPKNVQCYISQNKRKDSGKISASLLRDGVLSEIRKVFPDVELINAQNLDMGNRDIESIEIEMEFTNNQKEKTIQKEIVFVSNERSILAFCNAPQKEIQKYQKDFDLFLKSVKIR